MNKQEKVVDDTGEEMDDESADFDTCTEDREDDKPGLDSLEDDDFGSRSRCLNRVPFV